ncbi:MAG: glutamine--fructose-6-phosphate transaminase (isomerizing) [Eubacterium sp.]|nr:glutamine--fructose-6-phosphate transaminase (isomerizing) [Eubacterium sp.]
MCGIVGYIGKKQAAPILLDGLSKLEYRGYDSAGMAVFDGENIKIEKTPGRLKVLEETTHGGELMPGMIGIGHTRWATHGVPSTENAHPHFNASRSIAVVHNGIIENYIKLKEKMIKRGYKFVSDTDTEVLAHMLDYYYKGDPVEAIIKVMHRVEGSYALGIIFTDCPDDVFAVRKDSPLVIGKGEGENFIASDVPAILKYTRNVYYIQNEEIAKIGTDKIEFFNIDAEPIEKELHRVEWDMNAAEKGGYEFFMMKEMMEQPKVIRDTFTPHIKNNEIVFDELKDADIDFSKLTSLHIVACGSAYHAGFTGKYVIEKMARVPVYVDLASEFRYRNPILGEGDVVVLISQSGETADTKAAIGEAKAKGAKTIAIVNAKGSSMTREADYTIYTEAGPEISVATTKAYSAQLIILYMLAIKLAEEKGTLKEDEKKQLISDLLRLPEQVEMVLNNKERIQKFANRYIAAKDIFFIGRGIDYAIAIEGALKLKEISYIHAEAYAAGELKHGTISLIEENTLVNAVLTQEDLYDKTISNIREVKSRGAFVMAVTNLGHTKIEEVADYVVYIPETNKYFTNTLAIIPLQLFGYFVSAGKGYDVDHPRNLAKSVTVE